MLEPTSSHLMSLISEFKINLHLINTLYAQKAEYLAHFIASLPQKFDFHCISMSINVQPTGLNYEKLNGERYNNLISNRTNHR